MIPLRAIVISSGVSVAAQWAQPSERAVGSSVAIGWTVRFVLAIKTGPWGLLLDAKSMFVILGCLVAAAIDQAPVCGRSVDKTANGFPALPVVECGKLFRRYSLAHQRVFRRLWIGKSEGHTGKNDLIVRNRKFVMND